MPPTTAQPAADRERLGLHADCESCFGLCCVALAFTRSADFPIDKDAGEPCRNLRPDHSCGIHPELRERGFVGCTVYDCFGAGQKISRSTFAGQDWREHPEVRSSMFALLPVLRHVHELLWYLTEAQALTLGHDESLAAELTQAVERIDLLSTGSPDELLALDLGALRDGVNPLLVRASEAARARSVHQPRGRRADRRGGCGTPPGRSRWGTRCGRDRSRSPRRWGWSPSARPDSRRDRPHSWRCGPGTPRRCSHGRRCRSR